MAHWETNGADLLPTVLHTGASQEMLNPARVFRELGCLNEVAQVRLQPSYDPMSELKIFQQQEQEFNRPLAVSSS